MKAAFVLDVSACMPWCCEYEATPASDEVLDWATSGSALHVPALWMWEIVNVINVSLRRKRITADRAKEFLAQLAMLNFRVEPPPSVSDLLPLQRLAERHALTAYYAAYASRPASLAASGYSG